MPIFLCHVIISLLVRVLVRGAYGGFPSLATKVRMLQTPYSSVTGETKNLATKGLVWRVELTLVCSFCAAEGLNLRRIKAVVTNHMPPPLPFQTSATRRFVPFALNQFGRRGPHANALLLEFASSLVLRSGGCHLTRGPFAMTESQALQ